MDPEVRDHRLQVLRDMQARREGRRRIIRLLDSNGCQVGTDMDVTDVDNANMQAAFTIEVTERCNLGHWHRMSTTPIPAWGRAITTDGNL